MSRINIYALWVAMLAVCLWTTACSSDDDPVEPKITVAKSEMKFSKTGGTETLHIQSNVLLEVISNQTWCEVGILPSASATVSKYSIAVEPNTTNDDRTATLTVTGGGLTETVEIIQTFEDGLLFDKTTYEAKAGGETITVELKATGAYTITVNNSWITRPESRALESYTEHFAVAPNFGSERTGTITFSLGETIETITIKQAKGELPNIGMDSDAKTLAAKIKLGWNIGNTLEALNSGLGEGETFTWGVHKLSDMRPGETVWGNPKVTQELIRTVKAAGFNAVRIPCAWAGYLENEEDYTIKASWMERVTEVVNYCYAEDVYAILNIHWDGGWLENNCKASAQEKVNEVQHALWTQIAENFKNYDERLIFAGCNEPNADDAAQMSVLRSYEQTFIDAVRATGGNNAVRNLIVQGPNTDIGRTCDYGELPEDEVSNRLMLEVHFYPWQFALLEEDASSEAWGKALYLWGDDYIQYESISGLEGRASKDNEAVAKELFGKMKTRYVDQGYPVILGEYGAVRRSTLTGDALKYHLESRAYFMEFVTREAKNYGMVPFPWDAGGLGNHTMSVFNRRELKVFDQQLLDALLKGAQEGTYPF